MPRSRRAVPTFTTWKNASDCSLETAMKTWRQFVMNLEQIEPSVIEDVLYRHGVQALTLTDAGDNPVLEPQPGETPLWAETTLTARFSADTDFEELRTDLRSVLGRSRLPSNRVETLADRAWEREWLKDFRPLRFGERLVVAPHAFTLDEPRAAVVRLDPGLAFGTGTHVTTALCLEALAEAELDGTTILDFGCGSGILSVAALKLGATCAAAIDIDEQALAATLANAAANGVRDLLVTGAEIDRLADQFDIVVANILATTLIDNATSICDRLKPGGTLILSGVLEQQAADVTSAFADGVDFAAPVQRDGWVLLNGTRS